MFRRIRLLCIILAQLLAAGAVIAAERPVVREVLVTQEGSGARVEIRADLPLRFTSYLMPELAKWVIDLPGAKTTYTDDESKKMRTPPLERITVRQKEVNGDLFTRIGLDFKGEVDFSLAVDPLDKGHLVAVMTPKKPALQKPPATAPLATAPPSTPQTQSSTTVTAKPVAAAPANAAPAKTVSAVRITADSIRIEADGRIALPAPMLLNRPGRLVLDLVGLSSALEKVPVTANRFGIVRCRLGKSADRLRIVFEVSGNSFPDFQIKEILNGVEIYPKQTVKLD